MYIIMSKVTVLLKMLLKTHVKKLRKTSYEKSRSKLPEAMKKYEIISHIYKEKNHNPKQSSLSKTKCLGLFLTSN